MKDKALAEAEIKRKERMHEIELVKRKHEEKMHELELIELKTK